MSPRISEFQAEQSEAADVLAQAMKRAERRQFTMVERKKRKTTPDSQQTHALDNDSVHVQNESARQVDSVEQIDRDSELPTSWKRPSILGAPDPRPGFVQRWVRYKVGADEDTDNLEKMLEQGWRPRKRSTGKRVHELTADLKGKYGQYIVKRGLMLMELPESLAAQRRAYYRRRLDRMTESIDRDLFKENNRVMPLLKPERHTRTTVHARRGRLEANIPDDEGADA